MILGLNPLDFSILMGFLVVILAIGVYASRSVKDEAGFFLGGRKMGKTLQFFLNFGNATDSNGAVTMGRQVFTDGVAGMWLQLQTLFFTPLFWFTQPWFRRSRVITMADLFITRFNSKPVASAYAVFNIMVALITLGLGNYGGYSVVEAMMVKPAAQYTAAEATEVAGFHEYQELKKQKAALPAGVPLPEAAFTRFVLLDQLKARGELRSQIGVLSKTEFYVCYNLVIAIYVIMGGLKAAAITDAVQGILILVMSIILLPMGLYKVGFFTGLHQNLPAFDFWLSDTPSSNFTWYSIAAATFTSFIQIIGLQHNMSAGGSAKDENTARFGMLVGGFTKRLILICWMFCGLLGLALLSGRLDNPDYAWGRLSLELLPVGLIGIMLSGMLLGHMPAVGMTAVAVSGLVTRNVYEPLVPGKLPKHYLRVGQITIGVVLALSVAIAWGATSLGALTTNMITFNTFFGAVVFLTFFWRRLTVPAILIGFGVWMVMWLASAAVPFVPSLAQSDTLLAKTKVVTDKMAQVATEADVTAGRAQKAGETITVLKDRSPDPIYFEKIIALDPYNPASKKTGGGRFLIENWMMSAVLPVREMSAPQMSCARWLFDGLFPFLILAAISLVTKPSAVELAPAFYARLKTPVAPTPELDLEEVARSEREPTRFDNQKLFLHSNWEFAKWTRNDYLGFFGCCALVFVILGLLWVLLQVGKAGPWF